MKNMFWQLIAWLVSRRPVAAWLIERAKRTPYLHLDGYMKRWWLFNGYDGARYRQYLPSIRVHHILREDRGAHLHDHPWNARTFILDGAYIEQREGDQSRMLQRGDTAAILHGEFHHISAVSFGGVYTVFVTWGYQGTWGFKVDGHKVPWREYEALYPARTDV